MICDSLSYTTLGDIRVSRHITQEKIDTALDEILLHLNHGRGALLTSSYEYPGRYKRWAIRFVNPPLELTTRENTFTLSSLNDRAQVLLPILLQRLSAHSQILQINSNHHQITGYIQPTKQFFTEEERNKQPSAFTVIREILQTFVSDEDERLGLYGAFGDDLVLQLEPINQQDLVLYLPDELIVVDYYLQRAFRLQYDFATTHGSNEHLPRTGEFIDYQGKRLLPNQTADHATGEYANLVEMALDYFRQGNLFEVVPSQNFFTACEPPSSPDGFLLNLGGEYLIGASPEMFVRVESRCVETCPISGTIKPGTDALDAAAQIRQLINSYKDKAELTMCTDVDRNDKSRICEPTSVRVISRRQIELYSHLIHRVDHVEGLLQEGKLV
ncbi:anthranilate/para-aminobenzoate synthase component I [Nostoc sp. PCC 7524]|nr:anthranilate/para-aminobenzoate synthase component I [Nostoc sp. PCC 7524]